jgi:hypothetical protein
MRIELRDQQQQRRIGRIDVDPAQRPTRVSVVDSANGSVREQFLNWEAAVDDAGRLRRCVACGCTELYREKAFPQITGIIVVLAFAGAVIGLLGFVTPPVLGLMIVVLVVDTGILLFSRQRLVCYRCRSSYHGLPIARYHRYWDRATSERYPQPPTSSNGQGQPSEAPPALENRARTGERSMA